MSGKVLDQSVFDGLPPKYRWAVVGENGCALVWMVDPTNKIGFWETPTYDGNAAKLIGRGYDTTNWRQSKIEREKPAFDLAAAVAEVKAQSLHEWMQLVRAAQANPLQVRFKKLHPDAKIPVRATDGAAGFDLHSTQRIDVPPGQRMLLPTGIACAIPAGWCGQVWPRSGLAVKHGINVLAGMIDSDYRGELHVSLINHGADTLEVKEGDRIAQLVFVQVLTAAVEVEDLDDTARGVGGFGSTGK